MSASPNALRCDKGPLLEVCGLGGQLLDAACETAQVVAQVPIRSPDFVQVAPW